MPATYEPIATYTAATAQTTVTFSSIPATYTDIILVCDMKQSGTATITNGFIQLNSTTTGYSRTVLQGDGSTASSYRGSNADRMYFTVDANATNSVLSQFHFQNYANTNVFKTVLNRAGSAGVVVTASAHLWRDTSAISTISITASDNMGGGTADQFSIGTSFTLYGIKAA
jgi:hypothetical protein